MTSNLLRRRWNREVWFCGVSVLVWSGFDGFGFTLLFRDTRAWAASTNPRLWLVWRHVWNRKSRYKPLDLPQEQLRFKASVGGEFTYLWPLAPPVGRVEVSALHMSRWADFKKMIKPLLISGAQQTRTDVLKEVKLLHKKCQVKKIRVSFIVKLFPFVGSKCLLLHFFFFTWATI